MGGGDLNSKKSWHPNTMKNQEKVWKAEQAQAQEKKRISELQRERAEEKDRAELKDMVNRNFGSTTDDRLHWMYDKPDKKVQHEEFLLGKSIDNRNEPDKSDQDVIPAVSRRVVGSSMQTSAGDVQVDLARKIREDPLLLVKERERAARAALLNNPVQRRKLAELLRKEQEKKRESRPKKSKKKGKDLDNMLAAKLNALGGEKGLDVAALLASDDSSNDSSVNEKKKSKKKKKKKSAKKNKKKCKSDSNSSDDETMSRTKVSKEKVIYGKDSKLISRKRKSGSEPEESVDQKKSRRREGFRSSEERHYKTQYKDTFQHKTSTSTKNFASHSEDRTRSDYRHHFRSRSQERRGKDSRNRPSSEERAAKLAEMAAAGVAREADRSRRVKHQSAADAAASRVSVAPRTAPAHALPDSLEARIHSNRHYIQRDQLHMESNFAKR